MTRPTIIWFRRDLRLADNPALSAAHASGRPAIALFINPAHEGAGRVPGAASSWWLHHSLVALTDRLNAIGVPMVLASGDPREIMARLVRDTNAATVYWNRRYEASAIAVDSDIKSALARDGIEVSSFNSHLLREPWETRKADGEPYRVFTPFWKALRVGGDPARPLPAPDKFPDRVQAPSGEHLEDWDLTPIAPDWAAGFRDHWQPGEAGGLARLEDFLSGGLDGYGDARDRPDLSTTSRLSPHLAFGEIGPRLIWQATRAAIAAGEVSEADADKFLSEIAWREFSYALLYHFPFLATEAFQPKFGDFPWTSPGEALAAWQRGLTGYPIVDAGMRQLWASGWMHNRVRMVSASFLTKHLRIDWRLGEQWFWDTLVDADPANNAASWQWVAGSGADAAPFFRIFNPIIQSEKFDPDGDYVRRWVPELGEMPRRWIHKPWQASDKTLAEAGVELGTTYPWPIVDHAAARAAALDAYRSLGDPANTLLTEATS